MTNDQNQIIDFLKNCGKPKHFDFQKFISTALELTYSDEVENALKMLDLCPSFYRASQKEYLDSLKENIRSRIATPLDYSHHYLEFFEVASKYEKDMSERRHKEAGVESKFEDLGDMIHESFCYPRGGIMIDMVKTLNDKGITPHIVEFGPAAFWLPHGLRKQGLKFKYKPLTLNQIALHGNMKSLEDVIDMDLKKSEHHIFVCFEVIEHLWDDSHIVLDYLKQSVDFETVALSTPLHTFDGGSNDDKRELQHLRCYSLSEFLNYAIRNFPGRKWMQYGGQSQVLIGEKIK